MEKFYQKMFVFFHHSPILKKIILAINHYFPYILFVIYPVVLMYLFFNNPQLFLPTLLKPMFAFILVSVFRKIINRPRPYESMDIEPLKRHKSGESFPSRHAMSAMIISLVCLDVHIILGIGCLIIAGFICLSRILTGAHFISDVLTSVLIAIFIYLI